VWCDGSPADPRAEMRAARAREQRAALRREQRAALRREQRARTGRPLDAIDAGQFRALLDATDFPFPA